MVIKWGPEMDQMLFMKILETANPPVSIDTEAIVNAWPSEHETPSRCAITQHMAKIRHIAKDKGFNISFSVSNPRNPKSTGDSKTSAPRIDSSPTPRKNGQSKGRNELAKAVKRNRKAFADSSSDEDDQNPSHKKPRAKTTTNAVIKTEKDDSSNDEKPSQKKPRIMSNHSSQPTIHRNLSSSSVEATDSNDSVSSHEEEAT